MLLSDIGEGSSALFCLTDRTRCCSTTAGGERRGAWRFPNGNEVFQYSTGEDINRDRSYSSVILSRRNNVVGPTGIYACAIPSEADSSTTSRPLLIAIQANQSEGKTRSLLVLYNHNYNRDNFLFFQPSALLETKSSSLERHLESGVPLQF